MEVCPRSPIDADGDIIAPYWMQSTSGKVTVQQIQGAAGLQSKDESTRMFKEINHAFKDDLQHEDDIKGILIVTWRKMRNRANEKRQELVTIQFPDSATAFSLE